jgi:hypothetical protein
LGQDLGLGFQIKVRVRIQGKDSGYVFRKRIQGKDSEKGFRVMV